MRLKGPIDTETRQFLNYSQRYAYKALKHLTLNKNLNFKSEIWEETSEKSRVSIDGSIVDTDDTKSEASESPAGSNTRSPELPSLREVREKLRAMWHQSIEEKALKYKLLASGSGDSSMMPAKSLAKSAFSTKFARYEARKSRSASVLDVLPKVSCFRRRNPDRCLSCMHKSLRKTDETESARSRAPLPTLVTEARDDSESSSSEGLAEFQEELQTILHSRWEKISRHPERIEDLSDKATSSSRQVEQENAAISTKVDPNQSKGKTPKTSEDSPSKALKTMKAVPSLISVSSGRSKLSSSETHTSDEEPSSPIAMGDDPSRYKNMAPCHLPTILLHDMEPLRALRHKKPTTMEARIALMESATSAKEKSDDEYYEDVKAERASTPKGSSQPRMAGEETEKIGGEKDASLRGSKALLKVKSEQLIPPIVESARKDGLRRGYSCASIEDLSKDSARGTLGIPRSEAEDGRRGVISLEKVDSVKESVPSGSVGLKRRAELPLSTVPEISRFLEREIWQDESPAIVLGSLAGEFSSRVIKQHDADTMTAAAIRRAKLAARLTKLLADSKRYLSPDKFPSDLVFSARQPPVCNSRLLRRVLPLESYNLVAPLLGMSIWCPKSVQKDKAVRVMSYEEEESDGEVSVDLVVSTQAVLCAVVNP